jgi:hypothetical protein
MFSRIIEFQAMVRLEITITRKMAHPDKKDKLLK